MSIHLAAWANETEPSLFHQFTLAVAVAQSGGHPSATGLGTRGPGCGLGLTLHSCHQHTFHWVTPESWFKTNGVKIMARVIWLLCLLCPESVCSPDRDLDAPLHSGLNLFLSARWFSNTLLSFRCFFICFFTTRVSSGHSSWSQHPPGTLTRFGFAQPSLGRMTTWGQRETQPTAPSMQVHWCLQFGRKFSPFW